MHIAHYVQHIVRGAYAIEEVVEEVQSATQLHLKGTEEGEEEEEERRRRVLKRERNANSLSLSLSHTHTHSQ